MADINVKLRRLNGSTWDVLYPKTTVDQIVDLSTVGTSLLDKANPTENSFIRINQDGSVDYRTAAQIKTDIDAADAEHFHAIADVTNTVGLGGDGVSLATKLSGKADLTAPGGTVVSSQIPDFLFSGMRFIATATTGATLTSLLALINGSLDKEKKGGYFVATAEFSLTVGTNNALTVLYGDDGGVESGATVTVEKGDWIVYAGDNNFAIVNNTYRLANTSSRGIVALSAGTNTLRSQLHTSSSGEKVMDEFAVKNVMKEIFYESQPPQTGLQGDLWFEGTF